jgi:hypothetical protein
MSLRGIARPEMPKAAAQVEEAPVMLAGAASQTQAVSEQDSTRSSSSTPVPEAALSSPANAPLLLAAAPPAADEKQVEEQIHALPGETEPVTGTFSLPTATPNSSSPSTPVPADGAPAAAAQEATTSTQTDTKNSSADGKATPAASQPAKLYAPRIYYDRGTIVAEGDDATPVRLESNDARIFAKRVVLDTQAKTVKAEGHVRVEREVLAKRFNAFQPRNSKAPKFSSEKITETLQGDNFEYNFGTKQGSLDHTSVRLSNFNITAEQLIINGQKYIAHNVVIRPGGLSPEELKIYGTPPFSLHAREVVIDKTRPAPPPKTVGDTVKSDASEANVEFMPRVEVKSASLYFRGLRLMPVPSALLNRSGGPRDEQTYQLTPRIFFNNTDGILVTTRLQFPIIRPSARQSGNSQPTTLDLTADVGLSTRVGFRGGLELLSQSRFGDLSLSERINDVVSSQLTNRIELDRLPELEYRPPSLKLFKLPGSHVAGLQFGFLAGNYRENFTTSARTVEDTKLQGQVRFTTRLANKQGPYLDLFARSALYGDYKDNLNTQGFEIGYVGRLTSRINGQFSFSAQNVNGSTPFRFDRVEIRRELRTTFDVMLTPRWLVPIDLRYDLDRRTFRDKSFGLLRNYKTFAYGVVYQSARQELRLEIRQGF